jgi:HEAT repeat protein
MSSEGPLVFATEGEGQGDPAAPPRWRLALDRAQGLAHRAARVLENAPQSGADLAPVARPLEDAVTSIYAALDRRADGLGATRAAVADLELAALVLDRLSSVDPSFVDAVGWLREAAGELGVAEERFSRVPPEAPPPAEELRAAEDVPRLHRLEREPLSPEVRTPAPVPPPPEPDAPLPRPRTPEELDLAMAEVERRAEARKRGWREREEARARARAAARAAEPDPDADPPPGFARGTFAARTRDDFVAERTRECFEEVAMIGVQRAPLLGDPWRFARVLEKRMLAAIDAVASLGSPAVARVERLAVDAPAKDPSRGFAAAMILGCIDGRDALGAVERVLRHLGPADPEVAAHVGGALKLVPHPLLPDLLRAWLGDEDPAVRALAVDVLAYRGLCTTAELAAAARDAAPEVVAAALPALGLARAPELAAAIEPARAREEPALREAAWAALMLGGSPFAADVLAAELDGPLGPRAAVPLAIVGDERDAARLLERMVRAPTPGLVNAVGWAGAPEAVPALIDLLGHDDPVVQLTAAYALERLTGARLIEEVQVPPENLATPDVEEPDVGERGDKPPSLAREVSDARDRPSEGAGDTALLPSIDADRWRAHWIEHAGDYKPGLRYRRGSPYSPAISAWELDALPLTPGERRWLQRELVVRTGQVVRFDPHDFVQVQEEALVEWDKLARRAGGAAGTWSRPTRR